MINEYAPPTYDYVAPITPANYPHLRLNVIYEAARAVHTAPLLVKTSKPRKKKVRQNEVKALKARVESVEGSEVPENIINTAGEAYIKDCCEEFNERMEVSKWNGA